MAKVLLVHPDLSRLGGIENYFLKIKPHLEIDHESCGNSQRPGEKGFFVRIKRILNDYFQYWKKVSHPEVEVVHLNPSLQAKMFYRDWLYLWLAKLHGKKTVIFFHGWDTQFEQTINKQHGRIFRLLYGRADAFIVLASTFAESLRKWGIKQPVYEEVIVIEDEVFNAIQLEELLRQREQAPVKQLIFPSRLMRSKGIITTIRALNRVQQHNPYTGLIIAGDGEDAGEARQLVKDLGLQHTRFAGIVSGDEKYKLFQQSHLLCFPTEHSEGFPNTIVEAMAFGLPVITRPVGGVKDFFINARHGYITNSVNDEVFAELIEKTFANNKKYNQMAYANHHYAGKHFLASDAAKRLQRIYQSL